MRVNLHIKLEQTELFKRAQEIAKRDRRGVTDVLLSIPGVESWIVTHSGGNPQTLLEHAGNHKTLPIYRTCQQSSRKLSAAGFLTCQGIYHITPETCVFKNGKQRCYREASQ